MTIQRPRSIRWLILCGILLIAVIAAGTALMVNHFRERALANSTRELGNTALLLARHLDQELEELELAQEKVIQHVHSLGIASREDFEREMSGRDVHLLLTAKIDALPHIGRLSLVGPDGKLINSSYAWPVTDVNVADRAYFKSLKSDPQLATFLSEPVRSRLTGAWSIIFARKVVGSTGEFLGLVLGGIELAYFEQFFASVALGEDASIAMFNRDGTLLARHPRVDSMIGHNLATVPLFRHPLLKESHGTTRLISQVDGQDRLVAAHSVSHFRVVMMAATTTSAALADWRQQTKFLIGVAGFSALVVAVILFLIVRQLSREHESSKQSLILEKQRLDIAINNMAQGLLLFDASELIVVVNQRYVEMYRLSPDVAKPGCTFRDLIAHRKETGTFAGDVDDYCSPILRNISQGKVTQAIIKTADGRSIQVANRPLESGGWVSTHEDITERERLSIELRAKYLQLDTALEHMSQGLCMFDNEKKLVVCNDRYRQIYRLPLELITPGTPLRRIVEFRIAIGVHSADHGRHAEKISGQDRQQTSTVEFKDGRIIALKYQPMPDGGWVATHEDITERAEINARLRQQTEQMDIALSNMSQGLAMFDTEQRVVIANDRFAEMYGQTPDQVKPGTRLRDIIEHRITTGLYVGTTVDEVMDRMRERVARMKVSRMTSKFGDGRTITVSIQPRSDGGWVTTHQDITERENLKDRLDAALSNMAQGLAMFDDEQRLVLCNARFADMYGLLPEQVEPGTTVRQILDYCVVNGCYAGRNPDEMLASTMEHLGSKATGYYRTRLNAGKVYGVSVMPMSGGGVVTTHEDITERQRIEARVAHLAHHDALTDLPNRVLLRARLEEALVSADRQGQGVAVLYLDLDRFKEVNDTLGHTVGDLLLKSVAERLRSCVREDELVARLGGDEFAVVQISEDPAKSAAAIATRLIESLTAPHVIEGNRLAIATSVGIAVSPGDGTDPEQLLKNSDLALYGAKADGRGTYRFFEAAMNTAMKARRAMEGDLREALSAGELALHYQPILNLEADQICGCEALLRWDHPELGRVSPVDFIPVAEATGLIVPIGEWVLREACREATTWPDEMKVAVNLSVVQFKSRNLVQMVVSALAASDLSPSRLELEITESVLLTDSEATLDMLRQLHDVGVRIALDDFGTGYSSLSYLRSFPFDKIKIDRCFVRDLASKDSGSAAILRTVAQLGKSLDIATTAEGVETKEQLEIVRAEGCTEMQGYLLSAPVAAAAVRQLFSQRRERYASAA